MGGAAAGRPRRRAVATGGYKILDLRQKVEHLEGLLGYAFSNDELKDAVISEKLGLPQAAQWARKKAGASIGPAELSRLFMHFRLPSRLLDWRLFLMPFDEFVSALRKAGVGTSGGAGWETLQFLLVNPNSRPGGIRVEPSPTNRAGLGPGPPPVREGETVFSVGTRVEIYIDVPDLGHLLVLNHNYPAGETNCLMPSMFRPACAVQRGTVKLPEPTAFQPTLTVHGPAGDYRVYAIWTREEIQLEWVKAVADTLRVLDDEALTALADDLRSRTGTGAYRIRTAEYRVGTGRR